MFANIMRYVKKICVLALNATGWGLLIYLWYKVMFSYHGIHSTLKAFQNIALGVLILFCLYFVWHKFNLDSLSYSSEFSSKFIRIHIPPWTWTEVMMSKDNTMCTVERADIICKKKAKHLSSTRRFSYAAILIKYGCIKEAIGFLRPILHDPNTGQLTRKIAKSELEVLLPDVMHM